MNNTLKSVIAGGAGVICFLVGFFFLMGPTGEGRTWTTTIIGVLFLCVSLVMALVVINARTKARSNREDLQRNKPTFAVIILMIGAYSTMLTVAMHLFGVPKNVPGSLKYWVNLAVAISSGVFMKLRGTDLVRSHFGEEGGRRLELNALQALYVTMFVLCCSLYWQWLDA